MLRKPLPRVPSASKVTASKSHAGLARLTLAVPPTRAASPKGISYQALIGAPLLTPGLRLRLRSPPAKRLVMSAKRRGSGSELEGSSVSVEATPSRLVAVRLRLMSPRAAAVRVGVAPWTESIQRLRSLPVAP